jgi:hypothetical protein
MSRPLLALFAFAVLSPGCVPVTEPLGDIDKAEPDKKLLGKWQGDGEKLEIDVPAVKGNPKGLMRVVSVMPGGERASCWFHCTTVGKHAYATIYLDWGRPVGNLFADFPDEGDFGKYAKGDARRYCVIKYALDGDKLVLDPGSEKPFEALMKGAKIEAENGVWYKTPAGWLAKYLEKTGPDKIYDGSFGWTYRRAKK